jgi:signal transduction histidine kinase
LTKRLRNPVAERERKKRRGKRKTILVVDDNTRMVEVLRRILEIKGDRVVSAESAETGLEVYQRVAPDLVLTDLIMPGDTGLALLRWIREKDWSTPVVIVSGYGDYLNAVEAQMLGVDFFISKGGSRLEEALLKAIKECLAMSRAELEVRHLKASTPLLAAENQRLNEKLEHLSKEQADKSAGTDLTKNKAFCGAVAHGLKGEFLHIGNSTRAIRELADTSPGVQEECDLIERSVEYSELVLRRLLDYVDIGRPKVESISTSELLRRTELLVRPRLPSRVQLEITAKPSITEQRVSADIEQLMGVLLELINNAGNVLRETGGTIELAIEETNGELAISVKDNGPGIPEELRDILLKEQVSSKSGLGLGIFLSSKVVTALGGTLSLKASSKKGTTFTILLPITSDTKVS